MNDQTELAYQYTKEDMDAATRLQIWQELMRAHRGDTSPNATQMAKDAAEIYTTLRA